MDQHSLLLDRHLKAGQHQFTCSQLRLRVTFRVTFCELDSSLGSQNQRGAFGAEHMLYHGAEPQDLKFL